MSLEGQIRVLMEDARRAGDKAGRQVYSNILNALLNKAKELRVAELTEEQSGEVVLKLLKQNAESIDTCPEDRVDILEQLRYERDMLQLFAPEQMDEVAVRSVVQEVLSELGMSAPTVKDKGTIMRVLMPKVKGKADGKLVNRVLSEMFVS